MTKMNMRALLSALVLFCTSLPVSARIELGLGSDITLFSYKESLTAPQKSNETALFGTVAADVQWYFSNESHVRLRGDVISGVASRYDGSDLNTGAAVQEINIFSFATYEADLYIAVTPNVLLYVGYGSRAWSRYLSGLPGYRELYTWNYVPIGALAWVAQLPNVDIGVDISARPTFKNKINVITSETYANGEDSQMNLGGKTGYRIAVPARIHLVGLGPNWSSNAALWYEHSEFGQSDIVPNATLAPKAGSGILEPSSKTDQGGLDLILVYGF